MHILFLILLVVVGFLLCYFTIARKHKNNAAEKYRWYQAVVRVTAELHRRLDAKEKALQEAISKLEATAKADVKKVTSKVAKVRGRKGAAIATAS